MSSRSAGSPIEDQRGKACMINTKYINHDGNLNICSFLQTALLVLKQIVPLINNNSIYNF